MGASENSGGLDLAAFPEPWGNRASIYDHVTRHVHPEVDGLLPDGEKLPDDEIFWGGNARWVSGGFDGAFGRHGSPGDEEDRAQKILTAIVDLSTNPSGQGKQQLYDLSRSATTLNYVDDLSRMLVLNSSATPAAVRSIGIWLATRAPDREPVKLGIALVGLAAANADTEMLMTLGRHEEFTLYAVVGLVRMYEFPDAVLMELAKHVDGWGRIHIIDRLRNTGNPDVKRWMLREGYKTDVMNEYTAHACALAGDLLSEVSRPEIHDDVFVAACDIAQALLDGRGGPAESILDYQDGVEAMRQLLRHFATRAPALKALLTADALARFLRDPEEDQEQLVQLGWSGEVRTQMLGLAEGVINRNGWPELVLEALASQEEREFREGLVAANVVGVDAWEHCLEKVKRGDDYWYSVMDTDDPVRAERAVEVAEEVIPLRQIATGPALDHGLGEEFLEHSRLDWVLRGLARFPGLGWPLIKAGLQSSVVGNRQLAATALALWPRSVWTGEITESVDRAIEAEPDADIRAGLARIRSSVGEQKES